MTEKQKFHITDAFLFYEHFILKVSQNKDDYLKYNTDVTRKKERRKSFEGGKGFVFYRCQICNADREWLIVDRL